MTRTRNGLEWAFGADCSSPAAEPSANAPFNLPAHGLLAQRDGRLIGFARVISDDCICSWIAEVCVRPEWQGQGVGGQLVDAVVDRFAHTAIYCDAPSNQVEFVAKRGLSPRRTLVACAAGPAKTEPEVGSPLPDGVSIRRDMADWGKIHELYASVGFEMRGEAPERIIERSFANGAMGFLAFHGDDLVGIARAMSDGVTSAWLAELCVRPDWQGRGIGRALVHKVRRTFPQTAVHGEALAHQAEFFAKAGLPPQPALVACSRRPDPGEGSAA
ncbi:MAG: GNAT family N-acetyltransferase [Actinomycetota bacterium]